MNSMNQINYHYFKDMNNYIGIFDSGIGGLSVLKEIVKILPNEKYIYYADTINNPYGNKNADELHEIITKIVEYLINRNCKVIVIACNTVTSMFIDYLKEKYQEIEFIGIYPAIKKSYELGSRNTLFMATPNTIKSEKISKMINEYTALGQKITAIACYNLANDIEKGSLKEIDDNLNMLTDKLKGKEYDTVILGCTHYSIIKNKISKLFPIAKIIDNNTETALKVKSYLEQNNLISKDSLDIEFISTSNNNLKELYQSMILNNEK